MDSPPFLQSPIGMCAAAMLSTGVSVRLASGFTDPAKQEDETTSAWHGSVGLVDAAKEESVPGGLCKSNFPPLEDAEQNNLRSGQQCDIKLTHLIVIMGQEKEY